MKMLIEDAQRAHDEAPGGAAKSRLRAALNLAVAYDDRPNMRIAANGPTLREALASALQAVKSEPAMEQGEADARAALAAVCRAGAEEIARLHAELSAAIDAIATERRGGAEQMRWRCVAEALKNRSHPDDPTNDVWQCAYNHVAEEIAAAIGALELPA